ncbi:MAG: alpha/beta hydrolase [Ferrovibrio sp.]|uniref:alpha/beta fold hydrolase n=1 Tax=Ferrovibrio sp. TaxID=1917215 RepID=UPI0026141AEE|nr:alpha/beta hydrolase [Ferrovibrio sp.]MCW0233654.1 alpha/beta hydrolase [Ferrovibrio sp.]
MTDNVMPAGFPIGCGDTGDGRPLVLLHCSGADRQVWTRVMDAWSGMDNMPPRRILRPEFFGCGRTARWPYSSGFMLDDVVDLVCQAVGALDEPFDLVGHSFGGAAALHLALRMPERLRSLTVIEPTCFYLLKNAGTTEARLLGEITEVAQTILSGAAIGTAESRRLGMAAFVDYWNGAGKWRGLPPEMQQTMAQQVDVIANDFSALYAEPTRLSDVRNLQIPTLIVNGLQSPAPVQHIATLLERSLPRAERCSLPDAGHMIPLSHAKQLAGLIASWQCHHDAANTPVAVAPRRVTAGD